MVFRLLIQIKYAKFIMEKRDYHIKKPNLLRFSNAYSFGKQYLEQMEDMGVREQLLIENQVMLGRLIQQLQLFQRELLHFIVTMDDYFMNTATSLECIKFQDALQKMKG